MNRFLSGWGGWMTSWTKTNRGRGVSNELPNLPESSGWIVSGVLGVIATLSTAVATLYRKIEGQNAAAIADLKDQLTGVRKDLKESNEKHDECQKDRGELRLEVNTLKLQVNALECKTCKRGDS